MEQLVRPYKAQGRSINDFIVPVSGARDSYFIVHVVKNILGLNPLLVTYNKHYNTELGIRNLSYLKTSFGCNLLTSTISPDRVNRITRETLRLMGSIYWHCLAGQTALPVQVAYRLKIPLIIWGCHQGVDQVGMYSHLDQVEMTRKYRKEHDLMGFEAEDLIDKQKGISERDIQPYKYPHDKEIERVGVRGIYLSNYIRWDSKKQHEMMIDIYKYDTSKQLRTFDTYNDVDSFHYSGTHDYIKFLKYGYGKVTDHACREIRLSRMTREEGISFVRKYQNKKPKDLGLFLDWIGMTEGKFFDFIDKKRDSRIWQKDNNGNWKLLDSIMNHIFDPGIDNVRLNKIENCKFVTTKNNVEAQGNKYSLLSTGYVDENVKIDIVS